MIESPELTTCIAAGGDGNAPWGVALGLAPRIQLKRLKQARHQVGTSFNKLIEDGDGTDDPALAA